MQKIKLTLENINKLRLVKRIGIYQIIIKHHSYVGSSISLGNRLKHHLQMMKSRTHHNQTMQNCFNKYGLSEVYFSILEFCDKDVLFSLLIQ